MHHFRVNKVEISDMFVQLGDSNIETHSYNFAQKCAFKYTGLKKSGFILHSEAFSLQPNKHSLFIQLILY